MIAPTPPSIDLRRGGHWPSAKAIDRSRRGGYYPPAGDETSPLQILLCVFLCFATRPCKHHRQISAGLAIGRPGGRSLQIKKAGAFGTTTQIAYHTLAGNVNAFLVIFTGFSVLYQLGLFILYNIPYCNYPTLVLHYSQERVIPMYR